MAPVVCSAFKLELGFAEIRLLPLAAAVRLVAECRAMVAVDAHGSVAVALVALAVLADEGHRRRRLLDS